MTKTKSEVGKVIGCGGEVDLRKLSSLQSILRDELTEIKALDREIVEETREENIDQEVTDSCEFATCIYDCIEDIEVVFRENECLGKESPAATPQFSAHGSSSNQQATQGQVKLPKLELKRFYGNPVEWSPFWDSFNVAVHQNPRLSEVEKFYYLKSLLQGQPANSISGFSLTGENYKEAIRLLTDRS